ncbi:MAG: outer membrane beta-barrel protein [Phycisphaeraceae bacterium]
MKNVLLACIAIVLFGIHPARAELSDEPFLLRMAVTLDRQTNYASSAGRQATLAVAQGASANPAADDWSFRAEHPIIATLTSVHGVSETGTWINAAIGTVSFQTQEYGTFSLAYARTDTFSDSARNGFSDRLTSNEFFIGYGKKLNDWLSIGAQVHVIDATVREENLFFTPLAPLPLPLRFDTDLLSVDIGLGVLARLDEHWSIGIAGGIGGGSARSAFTNIFSSINPSPAPLPPGVLAGAFSDDTRSKSIGAGVGYLVSEQLGIYFDAQFLHVESNRAGTIDLARWVLGVEYNPIEELAVRSGILIDTDSQVTVSAGISYYGLPFPIELAYQYNASPEVRKELGRVHLVSLSIVIPF